MFIRDIVRTWNVIGNFLAQFTVIAKLVHKRFWLVREEGCFNNFPMGFFFVVALNCYCSFQERQQILTQMAKALEENMTEILNVNAVDIANAQEMKMTESMRARLVLNSKKVADLFPCSVSSQDRC